MHSFIDDPFNQFLIFVVICISALAVVDYFFNDWKSDFN